MHISFDQVREILDEAMEKLPEEIFSQLNGGVILLPEVAYHPESIDGSLYVLGRYNYHPNGLGRYINIYYGSFAALYGNAPRHVQVRKLTEVLHHELIHHLEGLAGDKSLEETDRKSIEEYKKRKGQ